MLTQDPRAVIEGRPYGRGPIIGIAAGLACALVVLGVDLPKASPAPGHSAAPFVVALLLALLPVPLLVAVVLLLDRLEPEPRGNLVLCFAWGAGVAALLAAVINTAGLLFITQPDLGTTNGQYVSATFGAPVVEETLKGAVLFWLLWRRRAEFDGPTDGIMYAAMVGLGFAMMENIGYYIGALVRPVVGGVQLLGYHLRLPRPALALRAPDVHLHDRDRRRVRRHAPPGRLGRGGPGCSRAMTLHGLWNGLSKFGLPGIAAAYLLVGCVLVGLIGVVVADRRQIVRLICRFLPAYAASGAGHRGRPADAQHAAGPPRRPGVGAQHRRRRGGPGDDRLPAGRDRAGARPPAGGAGPIGAAAFDERSRALLGLMTMARGAFLRQPPGRWSPPWAGPGQSGFGSHAQPGRAGPPGPVGPPPPR